MKKILLSTAVLLAVSIGAKAQFILGIKGGANFSKITTDNLKESNLTGYQAGIFMRGGMSWFVQPEIYLSGTGGKFYFPLNNGSASLQEGHVRFTNLNVPLLIGHSFGPQNINFRIMAGPVYTVILNKDKSFSQTVTDAYQDFGHYKNGALGYQAGAGVDVGPLTFDVRYEGGLTKINPDYGQKQNLWALSVGFKLL